MWLQLYAALLLIWPVPDPQVERAFEPPPAPWAAGHRGVDLAGKAGRPVRAVAPGRVSFAGTVAGRGVLSIELSGTGDPPLRTTYEPVSPTVSVGDRVTAGQPVATLQPGPSHCRPSSCLHWGLRRGDTYLDPLTLLRQGPSILLPVFDIPLPREGKAMATGPGAEATEVTEGTDQPEGGMGAWQPAGSAHTIAHPPVTRDKPAEGTADVTVPTAAGALAAVLAAVAAWAHRRLHRAARFAGAVAWQAACGTGTGQRARAVSRKRRAEPSLPRLP
ncbi:murein hydrolase activator EnvC family protein [Streptomyces gobiensis]|uniref:murein hydrolase activator EnvC family protein n=1 Tax=Streptomyces gobiensis TaxID=2875706 RepID=UPI001E57C9E6|nr:M23 family metallopeptidase [Streptomyces gobiensis]UGY93842.1 M23 family metallopeptidase [Streptomyces gobiensis]